VPRIAYPQQKADPVAGTSSPVATRLDLLEAHKAHFAMRGDRWAEANVLNRIGFLQERHGCFSSAVELHAEALELFRAEGDPIGIGDSLNNLGVVLGRLGEGEAEKRHREALEIRLDYDNERVSNSKNNLGVLLSRADRDGAREYFAAAEGLARGADDQRGLGKIINNTTVLSLQEHDDEDDFDQACREFERALPLRAASEDQRGHAKTKNNLGVIHTVRGAYGKAEEFFQRAAALADSIEDNVSLLHILENWLVLTEAWEAAAEPPKRIVSRIAGLRAEAKLPLDSILGADCEAYPVEFQDRRGAHQLIALLSSGSATPATSGELREKVEQANFA
jgi:tetratricopeptide (TPR) repeat protein